MPKIKYRFSLSQVERDELQGIVAKGKHNSQKVLNALILLNYDGDAPEPRTLTEQEIANVLKVSEMKIHRVKQRFVEEGLDIALNGHERERVYKRKADGDFEAHLVALSCSERLQDKRSGRCGYSRIRLWSWGMLKVFHMRPSGAC